MPNIEWEDDVLTLKSTNFSWSSLVPETIRTLLSLDINFESDFVHSNTEMVTEVANLRTKIDKYFGWEGVALDEKQRLMRGVTQAVLSLYSKHCDDNKNELLLTKLFALLVRRRDRN